MITEQNNFNMSTGGVLASWRASETLTEVTQLKIGDVFIYMYGRTYVILYFDPPYFCVCSAFDPVPNFTKKNPPV